MYDVDDYLAMLADRVRTDAYCAAIRAVVRPGDRVLELGTGFGFFGIVAAKCGAAQVTAVEPSDVIALGPALARRNGVDERMTFIQAFGERTEAGTPADLLIEDLRGVSPLHAGRLPALLDARRRLLRPGAAVIPARDRLQLTPAEAPRVEDREGAAAAAKDHGIAIDEALDRSRQGWRRVRPDAAAPLAPTMSWAELDYATFTSLDVVGEASWTAARAGLLAGFVASFETELAPGIGFATGPGSARTVYDCGWLPLTSPIPVVAGQQIHCRMRALHDGEGHVLAWSTTVRESGVSASVARDEASTLLDRLRTPERRARREAHHRPVLGTEARMLQEALSLADGERSLEAIAERLHAHFPGRFAAPAEALRWAGEQLAALDEQPPL